LSEIKHDESGGDEKNCGNNPNRANLTSEFALTRGREHVERQPSWQSKRQKPPPLSQNYDNRENNKEQA
jgi:hypothetical protein